MAHELQIGTLKMLQVLQFQNIYLFLHIPKQYALNSLSLGTLLYEYNAGKLRFRIVLPP